MSIGTTPIGGENFPSGIGYIVLPPDIDREEYIALCYRSKSVSIRIEDGAFYKRVSIPEYLMSYIDFPEKKGEIGSPVYYISNPVRNQLYIVSVYSADSENISDLSEKEFKIKRTFQGNQVEISGSPKQNYLGLKVDSQEGSGQLYLKVISKDNSGKLLLEVSGDLELISNSKTTLKSLGSTEIVTYDPGDKEKFTSIRQSEKQTDVTSEKVVINDGDEPFLLGKKWKAFMKDLITEISNITTTTALGTQPVINKAQLLQYIQKLDDNLSQEAYLKK